MPSVIPFLKLYRAKRISKFAVENELTRDFFANIPNAKVVLTAGVGGRPSCSLVAGLIPVINGSKIDVYAALDDYLVGNVLSAEETESVLSALAPRAFGAIKDLALFKDSNTGSEVSLSDCLLFYFNHARNDFVALPKDIIDTLEKYKIIDFSGIQDAILALRLGREKAANAIDYVLSLGLLPKEYILAAKTLFASLNVSPNVVPEGGFGHDIETPGLYSNYNKILHTSNTTVPGEDMHTTNNIYDPTMRKVLNPDDKGQPNGQ